MLKVIKSNKSFVAFIQHSILLITAPIPSQIILKIVNFRKEIRLINLFETPANSACNVKIIIADLFDNHSDDIASYLHFQNKRLMNL